MAEQDRFKVPLFDGTNFDNWKFRMETLLKEHELLEYVKKAYTSMVTIEEADSAAVRSAKEGQLEQSKRNDRKCKSQIVQRIADSHLEYVKDEDTAHGIWTVLSNTFERKGIASQLRLRKLLLTMKYSTSETMGGHFLKFDRLIRELRSTGAKLEDTDVVCHLLLTMPTEYDVVVTAIETLSTDKLTLNFVKNRLLDEEAKRSGSVEGAQNDSKTSTAFVTAANHNKASGNKQPASKRFPYKCYNCGLTGHKRTDCKKKPKKNKNSEVANVAAEANTESGPSYTFCAGEENFVNNSDWYLDSGATEHMANEHVCLNNVKLLPKPLKIKVAKSGQILTAKEVGELNVQTLVNGEVNSITVKEVLLVPGLQCSLLSIRKLDMNKFIVSFEDSKGVIRKGNTVVAIAYLEDKLYKLDFCEKMESANVCTVSEDAELWHKRLGHISNNGLKKVLNITDGIKIDKEDKVSKLCRYCVEGKQTKLPHKQDRVRAKRPLQLIHSDLCGPMDTTSYDGKKYVLTFIDDFTHFTVAYTLSLKSEVLRHFKMFKAMAEAHFNKKVSRFRCDNGREYISNETREYFESNGIQYEFTIRYTPQQNGVAERMNRTIIEKARCMILNSNTNKRFWTEAVLAAVYLINRSPTCALQDKVPAELWYGERPDLRKLRVFGSIVYLHIPKEIVGGKFESRSKKCHMMGYCPNGYRLWCPEDNKLLFGRDVVFDETKFSFETDNFYDKSLPSQAETEDNEKLRDQGGGAGVSETSDDTGNQSEVSTNDQSDEKSEATRQKEKGSNTGYRRSSRVRSRPKHLDDYCAMALSAESFLDEIPENLSEIENREDKDHWKKAVQDEIDSLLENGTWDLVELPPGKRVIDNRWIFKIKRDENGDIERYKARLVVKGCSQRKGFDYSETYAPVARLTTVRTLLSVINHEVLLASQMDVKNAFLHGHIEEEIYMKQPEGINNNSNLVCKLNKSLYGLKQAPRAWNARFDEFVRSLGFRRSENDRCLYIRMNGNSKIYLLLYVDDIIIAGDNEKDLRKLKAYLMNEFSMKDLGKLHNFLGIKLERTKAGMFLSQSAYMKNLLSRFKVDECKAAKTPMEVNPWKEQDNLNKENLECIIEKKPYRELIGCLMYLMLTTRPDLSASVNYFSRFQSNATDLHWNGLKRILRYIRGTLNYGLFYRRSGSGNDAALMGYADADWAGDADRKSTSGFLFRVYNATVLWATRKQTTVALSSTEAEYVALASAATELVWLQNLLRDFGVMFDGPTVIFEDNQSCIHLLDKWKHRRLKHIDVKYNFIRELFANKVIDVKYVPSKEQVADIFTKGLTGELFIKLRESLGITEM
ncbi:Gag-pol polyprotein [Camponotus japonicus]